MNVYQKNPRGAIFGRYSHDDAFLRLSWICAVAVSILLMGTAGCGKKAMPTAPESKPVPTVSDLYQEVVGTYVNLSWTVPDNVNKGLFGEGKAIVSRARTKLSDGVCDGCPLVFQRIAELPIAPGGSETGQTHKETLFRGFRYTYRVILQMDGGRSSRPSNLVAFDY